ncbi:antibiotic biosynthesis monooxygenase family protein [Rhodococcus tibetensis]|uniref:Antibiotic biosynthesis monooxygenase n=1 Tax=Rhodococcus tibetensis TaxID=2965064 RepID=A0ABT1QEI1_9NOCA|nr:antibiotic biosynthesis monooxygenase [Rhodococcus sp. FXJ9.536]MCQ4120698.1 antibiotic biosynthesis monooxygenase [Rhodococcus sp. FXJ9.536]
MILEHAVLQVAHARATEFESTFGQAKSIISSMPGFLRLRLSRGLERPNIYILLVEWEELEDHTHGFRQSSEYQKWRNLLHHFYDPFPLVEHFTPVHDA